METDDAEETVTKEEVEYIEPPEDGRTEEAGDEPPSSEDLETEEVENEGPSDSDTEPKRALSEDDISRLIDEIDYEDAGGDMGKQPVIIAILLISGIVVLATVDIIFGLLLLCFAVNVTLESEDYRVAICNKVGLKPGKVDTANTVFIIIVAIIGLVYFIYRGLYTSL